MAISLTVDGREAALKKSKRKKLPKAEEQQIS